MTQQFLSPFFGTFIGIPLVGGIAPSQQVNKDPMTIWQGL